MYREVQFEKNFLMIHLMMALLNINQNICHIYHQGFASSGLTYFILILQIPDLDSCSENTVVLRPLNCTGFRVGELLNNQV